MDKNFEAADINSIKALRVSDNSNLIYFNIAKSV